uniref:Uncharacterized protein n=1 Tax=Labrus bergylta TaxID=56723 RepID=A0A3Q3E2U2_9LABR
MMIVPLCSIVCKAFLAQLASCSRQPNYWVKPWLSLPRVLHCILHPSQTQESFLCLSADVIYTSCSCLAYVAFPLIETQDMSKTVVLEKGDSEYDAARRLITAVEAFLLVFAQSQIIRRGRRLLVLGSMFFHSKK